MRDRRQHRVVSGETVATVAPVTHAQPLNPSFAIEIPPATKQRLGLDADQSWIIADDLNRFLWPGVDLRSTRRGSGECAYGQAPRGLHESLKAKVLAAAQSGRLNLTTRFD